MPKVPPRKPKTDKPKCKACGGTGVNSKGGVCFPCLPQNRAKQ